MNRLMAIVGLDIFVLLSLPILAGGRPWPSPQFRVLRKAPTVDRLAYDRRVDEDYAAWVDMRLRALMPEPAPAPPAHNPAPPEALASLEGERADRAAADEEQKRRLEEALQRAEELKAQLEAAAGESTEQLKDAESALGRSAQEVEELRARLAEYELAESGGHIAAVAGEARGRVSFVAAELGATNAAGGAAETVRAEGMVVPVMFGGRVHLVASASALGLTDPVLAGEQPATVSHFSAAVLDKDGAPNSISKVRFFRHEKGLVALETAEQHLPRGPAFRPSPHDFLLNETVIVLSADGTYFEARFMAREGYIKLTQFRAMKLLARWIRTSQQSPARTGDLVLDHEGNVVAILVSTTVGYILPLEQRLGTELTITEALRDKNSPPDLPEKLRLASVARDLYDWLQVQRVIEQPFRRE